MTTTTMDGGGGDGAVETAADVMLDAFETAMSDGGDVGNGDAPAGAASDASGAPGAPEGGQQQQGQQQGQGQGEPYHKGRAWKLQKGDQVLDALDGVDVPTLLKGEAKASFRANDKDVSLTLDELVDRAQRFYGLVRTQEQLRSERNQYHERVRTLEPELEGARAVVDEVAKAFESFATDQGKALLALKDKYLSGLDGAAAAGAAGAAGAGAGAEPTVTPEQRALYDAGAQVVTQHLQPYAETLAAVYPESDAREITRAIVELVGMEPEGSLTAERLDQIIHIDLPTLLEESGYVASGERPRFDVGRLRGQDAQPQARLGITPRGSRQPAAAATESDEVKALRARVAELESAGAGGRTPPAPGGARGASAVAANRGGAAAADPRAKSSMLDLSNAESAHDVLESLKNLR